MLQEGEDDLYTQSHFSRNLQKNTVSLKVCDKHDTPAHWAFPIASSVKRHVSNGGSVSAMS
jgi:hypothetical protein